jgi:hypothetical protein
MISSSSYYYLMPNTPKVENGQQAVTTTSFGFWHEAVESLDLHKVMESINYKALRASVWHHFKEEFAETCLGDAIEYAVSKCLNYSQVLVKKTKDKLEEVGCVMSQSPLFKPKQS